jgi:hypothetical protein
LREITSESGNFECKGINRLFGMSKDGRAKDLRIPSMGFLPCFSWSRSFFASSSGTPSPFSLPITPLMLMTLSDHSYNPLLARLTRTSSRNVPSSLVSARSKQTLYNDTDAFRGLLQLCMGKPERNNAWRVEPASYELLTMQRKL